MSRDEQKAIAFIALLLGLSAAARIATRPEPLHTDLPEISPESLHAAVRQADAESKRRKKKLAPDERIPINLAGEADLDRLAGVGPALAARVVAYRDSVGPFRNEQELRAVRGFGPALLEKNRKHLDFGLPRGRPPRRPPAAPAAVQRLDLNRASAAQLEALPGVGPALARRIVAYRDSAGRFTSVDELRRVRGVGPSLLERIRPVAAVPP